MNEYENMRELSRRLLPCPVCGGKASLANYAGGWHGSPSERKTQGRDEVVAECAPPCGCGLAVWGARTAEDAITRWNRRVSVTNELKPCPFCGSIPQLILGEGMFDGNEMYFVRCMNPQCRAEMVGSETKEQAITRWNQGRRND